MHNGQDGPSNENDKEEPNFKKEKPLGKRESKYVGLSVAIRKTLNSPSFNPKSNQQPELVENQEKSPLFCLFPELHKNRIDVAAILEGNLEPEEITTKLVGKMAAFANLKKSRQGQDFFICKDLLPTIFEEEVFFINDHKHRGNLKL